MTTVSVRSIVDDTLPGPGGWYRFQWEDPSGNLIEPFEPTRPEAQR